MTTLLTQPFLSNSANFAANTCASYIDDGRVGAIAGYSDDFVYLNTNKPDLYVNLSVAEVFVDGRPSQHSLLGVSDFLFTGGHREILEKFQRVTADVFGPNATVVHQYSGESKLSGKFGPHSTMLEQANVTSGMVAESKGRLQSDIALLESVLAFTAPVLRMSSGAQFENVFLESACHLDPSLQRANTNLRHFFNNVFCSLPDPYHPLDAETMDAFESSMKKDSNRLRTLGKIDVILAMVRRYLERFTPGSVSFDKISRIIEELLVFQVYFDASPDYRSRLYNTMGQNPKFLQNHVLGRLSLLKDEMIATRRNPAEHQYDILVVRRK